LKKFLFPIFSLAKPFIPLKALIGLSGEKMIFPFYHAVTDIAPPHLENLYKIKSLREFERDLDFLLKHFIPLSITDIINLKEKPSKPSFHLSFDDGLREVCDYIEPLLTRKGVPATFFINPDFVDNKNLFYRYKASVLIHFASSYQKTYWKDFHDYCKQQDLNGKNLKVICSSIKYADRIKLDDIAEIMGYSFESYLREFQPYLSLTQLEGLVRKGFTIGSHSMDHPEYKNLNGKEMLHQTLQSSAWVKEKFHQKYSVFAFPFSDEGVGRDFFHALGHDTKPLIDLSFGTAGIKRELIGRHKQRIPIEAYNLTASSVIFSEYLYYFFKMPFGKNIIYR
jgi:peptidoglycan/xylan/chitin deacetylase (PgdA/CDA1 family)